MHQFKASREEILLIKQAIKKHDMRSITWQSVASRPATIQKFLEDAGMIPRDPALDPEIFAQYFEHQSLKYAGCCDHIKDDPNYQAARIIEKGGFK